MITEPAQPFGLGRRRAEYCARYEARLVPRPSAKGDRALVSLMLAIAFASCAPPFPGPFGAEALIKDRLLLASRKSGQLRHCHAPPISHQFFLWQRRSG